MEPPLKGKAFVLPTAPAYSFGGRHGSTLPIGCLSEGPGPAAYSPKLTSSQHKRGPAAGFTTSTSLTTSNCSAPGPLDYSPEVGPVKSHGPAYSMAGRSPKSQTPMVPGPGQYEGDRALDTCKSSSPSFSIPHGRVDALAPESPGPHTYDPVPILKAAPKFSMSSKGGSAAKSLSTDVTPGPGQYCPEAHTTTIKKSAPAYSMSGHLNHSDSTARFPGPGDYDVPSPKSCNGHSFSQATRTGGSHKDDLLPGPGSYEATDAPTLSSPLGHSIESWRRNAPSVTIPLSTSPSRSAKQSPGPGDYSPSEPMRRSGPSYSFRGAAIKSSKLDVPGPGQYSPQEHDRATLPLSPSYSMTFRHELPPKAPLPGPHDYSPLSSPNRSLKGSLNGSFSGEKRVINLSHRGVCHSALDTTPGPGDYDGVPSSLKGPSFTMGKRFDGPFSPSTPGPADYDVGNDTLGVAVKAKDSLSVSLSGSMSRSS